MKRNDSYVWVRPKGSFYGFNTYCHTLKDAMKTYPLINKRSLIAEWWRNPINYNGY